MDNLPERIIREMRTMDKTGDTKLTWDTSKPDEVEHARKTFNELRAKGYTAFAVKREGERGKVMTEFDPDMDAMILAMVKPISGG